MTPIPFIFQNIFTLNGFWKTFTFFSSFQTFSFFLISIQLLFRFDQVMPQCTHLCLFATRLLYFRLTKNPRHFISVQLQFFSGSVFALAPFVLTSLHIYRNKTENISIAERSFKGISCYGRAIHIMEGNCLFLDTFC